MFRTLRRIDEFAIMCKQEGHYKHTPDIPRFMAQRFDPIGLGGFGFEVAVSMDVSHFSTIRHHSKTDRGRAVAWFVCA